ncbi:10046_t:CDS:2, partial [Entrophospora sp. SA101]
MYYTINDIFMKIVHDLVNFSELSVKDSCSKSFLNTNFSNKGGQKFSSILEKRQRRLYRNRIAAKECRRKKKAYVADLEEKATHLEEENVKLRKELEELKAKANLSAMKIDENVRLAKE